MMTVLNDMTVMYIADVQLLTFVISNDYDYQS